jgi:hypothetical protein
MLLLLLLLTLLWLPRGRLMPPLTLAPARQLAPNCWQMAVALRPPLLQHHLTLLLLALRRGRQQTAGCGGAALQQPFPVDPAAGQGAARAPQLPASSLPLLSLPPAAPLAAAWLLPRLPPLVMPPPAAEGVPDGLPAVWPGLRAQTGLLLLPTC